MELAQLTRHSLRNVPSFPWLSQPATLDSPSASPVRLSSLDNLDPHAPGSSLAQPRPSPVASTPSSPGTRHLLLDPRELGVVRWRRRRRSGVGRRLCLPRRRRRLRVGGRLRPRSWRRFGGVLGRTEERGVSRYGQRTGESACRVEGEDAHRLPVDSIYIACRT